MEEEIQLISAGFNGWLEAAESELTKARDALALLESEERRLLGIWESGARQQWDREFQKKLSEIGQAITGMEGLFKTAQESAEALLLAEKELTEEAERL